MKPIYKYFLFAIIATTLIPFSSCKKGANDPFLSLSSRKGRLEGTWKLTAQTYKSSEVQGNTTTTKEYTYDGANMTIVTTMKIGNAAEVKNTFKYSYTESITFTKENTYVKTEVESGATTITDGSWAFLGKDKGADLKKKEAIVMHSTKTTMGSAVSKSGKTENPETKVLDKLTKSEMVVTINELNDQGATNTKSTIGSSTYTQ